MDTNQSEGRMMPPVIGAMKIVWVYLYCSLTIMHSTTTGV